MPALDGLRAVAILSVMIFHAAPGTLPGGFVGVDVFFVLSGFLITSVIQQDLADGSFTLKQFYSRRVRRLWPNHSIMVVVTVFSTAAVAGWSFAARTSDHAIWSLMGLSNFWVLKKTGGYWAESAVSLPLLHTWSLAVEEQFYLVFPPIFALLARRRWFPYFLGFVCAASALTSVFGTYVNQAAAFYMLPTRAWELMLGCLLAMQVQRAGTGERGPSDDLQMSAMGWLGFAMIMGSCLFVSDKEFPGLEALAPAFGAVMVLASVAHSEKYALSKILSHRVLVKVGLVSYSLYVWHWPALVLGRIWAQLEGKPVHMGAAAGLTAGVLAALLVYAAVETRLRRRGPGTALRLVATITILLVAAGICAVGTSWRDDPTDFSPTSMSGVAYTTRGWSPPEEPGEESPEYEDVTFPKAPVLRDTWSEGGMIHKWGGELPEVVILGSSHAAMYCPVIDEICRDLRKTVAFLCADGTSVFFDGSYGRGFDDARMRWLKTWRPRAVLAIDRWDARDLSVNVVTSRIRELAEQLTSVAQTVVFFSQVPVLECGHQNVRRFAQTRTEYGRRPRILPDGRQSFRDGVAAELEKLASDHKVMVVRVDRNFMLPDGSVRYYDGRSCLYGDDDHLSDAGVAVVRSKIRDVLRRATGTRKPEREGHGEQAPVRHGDD